MHDSIKPPVRSPNLSESSSAPCAAVSSDPGAQPSPARARYERPHNPHAKLDSDKSGNSATDQTCWLDRFMKCDGDHPQHIGVLGKFHHYDTSVGTTY